MTSDRIKQLESENEALLTTLMAVLAMRPTAREQQAIQLILAHLLKRGIYRRVEKP